MGSEKACTAALSETLQNDPAFAWVTKEHMERFRQCFQLEGEWIPRGSCRPVGRRIGLVLKGNGRIVRKGADAAFRVPEGGAFWEETAQDAGEERAAPSYAADTDSLVLWAGRTVLEAGCYGMSCAGIHYRFEQVLRQKRCREE